MQIKITVQPDQGTLIVPVGTRTPHADVTGCAVDGAITHAAIETTTGQTVLLAHGDAPLTIRYEYGPGSAYPNTMFEPRHSRFTRAAAALADEAELCRGRPVADIARHVAEQFTYGHPDTQFYEGANEVPQLCGLTEGSCVDINLYFIALLRAAGIEAGYVTGYFFPEEKGDHCEDMHCWVVTRQNGLTQEWDIAHHLKMGTRDIAPALDPKPGRRLPVAHSMGLQIPAAGLSEIKLLGEPMWLRDGLCHRATLTIRLRPS